MYDPLIHETDPDRLHYSTGELLGADDFIVEQTYHRRQLARALLYLQGPGSVAGLRVVASHRPGEDASSDEVELKVEPGMAIDRVGRLIEVPRPACLRMRRWFDFGAQQTTNPNELNLTDLRAAWRADGTLPQGGAVVADVFLSFQPCDRGYTPAFATGPFDALDASQPSRVRDGYELVLIPRQEADGDLPVASDPWEAITGASIQERMESAHALSLDMWQNQALPPSTHEGAWREYPGDVDPKGILLARIRIPSQAPVDANSPPRPDWVAAAWPGSNDSVDNTVRNFLLPPAALAHVVGV